MPVKLNLEKLERRDVPTTYIWAPIVGVTDNLFSTASNWWNPDIYSNGGRATSPPNSGVDVLMPRYADVCKITSSQACKSISSRAVFNEPWYSGTIEFSGSLNVWGGSSLLTTNPVTSTSSSGKLNIIGGTFDTRLADFNTSTTNRLDVYVSNSGTFVSNYSGTSTIRSNITAGLDISNNASAGTVRLNGNVSMDDNLLDITSDGKLEVNGNLTHSQIDNSGEVDLITGSVQANTGIMFNTNGGMIKVSDVDFTIDGGVSIQNGNLFMGATAGTYNILTITGALVLGSNAIVDVDVALNHLTNCDKISANTVSISSTGTGLVVLGSGTILAGNHHHTVLEAADTFTGTFASYSWQTASWTTTYADKTLYLSLPTLLDDQGPMG